MRFSNLNRNDLFIRNHLWASCKISFMTRLVFFFLFFLLAMPAVLAQGDRRNYRYLYDANRPPSQNDIYRQRYQLQDPVYQGDFRLLGNVQVDQKLMRVWDAARDAYHILDQVSFTMSSCMQFEEREQQLHEDYRILEADPSGRGQAAKFRQVEALVRQAREEFRAYHYSIKNTGHDANNPHIRAGGDLLEQARKILEGSDSFIDKLGAAAQGVAGAAAELARMVQQMSPGNTTQGTGKMPPVAPSFKVVQGNLVPPPQGGNSGYPGNRTPSPSPNTLPPPSQNTQPPQTNPTPSSEQNTKPPDSGTFAKPTPPIPSPPNHPNLEEKLKKFGEALQKRALNSVTDPNERERIIGGLAQKFDGIGEGLNEAKEEVKHGATSAFNAAVQATEAFQKDPVGTMNAVAEAAGKFGEAFANATERAIDTASKDPYLFDKLLKGAVASAAEASANYSKLSQKEQGKILGKALFWSVNPGGSLEGAQLTGQAFSRAGNVLKPHVKQLGTELKELYGIGKGKLTAASNKLAQSASKWGGQPQLAEAGAYGGTPSSGWKTALAEDDPFKLYMQADEGAGVGGTTGGAGGKPPAGGIKPTTVAGELSASELAAQPEMQKVLQRLPLARKIEADAGQEVANAIRRTLKGTVKDIDKKNISIGVLKLDGNTEVIYSLSGSKMPGAIVPVKPVFETIPTGIMPRYTDAEYKILEAVAERVDASPNSKFSLAVFTEQKPCDPSCVGVIRQFRDRYLSRFDDAGFSEVTYKFDTRGERIDNAIRLGRGK